ncbi:hypothetical protein [Enterobacter asburiae]|uniref:tail fiber/spike domain-containing protein n=1 Tax=Enterobacter asburiae TaxID=61645 RepID=UPI001CC07526|nr:hypothetical protein [Enterobacter asburiae]
MATQPTNLPVPSESPRDLKFNAGKIDEYVTSMGWTYTDRFGQKHYTIEGNNYLAQQAMAAFGYVALTGKTFTTGATINQPNEVLLNTADGEYYKWTGSFASGAKVVPANSTPESTGGIGPGKWLGVGDTVLRSDLLQADGGTNIKIGAKTLDESLPIRTSDPRWNLSSSNSRAQNSTNLNVLIDEAISSGRIKIMVDNFFTVDDEAVPIRKKTEVFFIKDGGEINGLYRRASIPPGAPSNVRVANGVRPSGMTTFYRSKNTKVVIMGDSISTDGPNALSMGDSMASIIEKQITSQNPNSAIDFQNRAIGGQRWIEANTFPTAFPAWYTDTSKPWLDYVKADSPDLLILAFGMNDANGFNAGALHSVINKINSWEKVPSIIFITNPVPSMATTWSGGAGFYDRIYQEGRDWAAGYARTYANFYGHSVLDINRQFCLIRDGRDYLDVPLERVGVYNQSYIHDTNVIARDFSLSGDISSWPAGKTLLVKVGSGSLDIVYITNQAGFYKINAFCEGQQTTSYVDVTTTVAVTSGQTLDISVKNDKFTLFAGITKVITFNVIRTGGEIALVAEWQDTPGSGPFSSITASAGNFLSCQYTARDSDIWGHDDGTANTKQPEGGNGINHYSSKGLSLIVNPVVRAFDFTKRITTTIKSITTFNSGVTALTPISVERTGNTVSFSGRLRCSSPATYKLFNLPNGYIPATSKSISSACVGSSSWALGIVFVDTDGSVYLAFGSATDSLALDGVSFEI